MGIMRLKLSDVSSDIFLVSDLINDHGWVRCALTLPTLNHTTSAFFPHRKKKRMIQIYQHPCESG